MDLIAVLNECDQTALGGLRGNVSDSRASGSAGEASICDERNVSVKTLTNDRRSRSQHLRHSGTALRTFVANYYNVACLDVAAEDSVTRSLFAVEYARCACEVHHLRLYCALLNYGTMLCKVAAQDSDTAVLAYRGVDFVNYNAVCVLCLCDTVSLSTGNGQYISVYVAAL